MMAEFKFLNGSFANFLNDSINNFEKVYEWEYLYANSRQNEYSVDKRIIINLMELTLENRVIWSVDSDDVLRGIIIDEPQMASWKVLIKENSTISGIKYVVSFDINTLYIERNAFCRNDRSCPDELSKLTNVICNKLLQQSN